MCVHVWLRCSVMVISLWPHGLKSARLPCPWDSPGKNTRAGCHFLQQGIFPTQGSNPHVLHWQAHSLPLRHQGSPCIHIYIHTHIYICVLFFISQMTILWSPVWRPLQCQLKLLAPLSIPRTGTIKNILANPQRSQDLNSYGERDTHILIPIAASHILRDIHSTYLNDVYIHILSIWWLIMGWKKSLQNG